MMLTITKICKGAHLKEPVPPSVFRPLDNAKNI